MRSSQISWTVGRDSPVAAINATPSRGPSARRASSTAWLLRRRRSVAVLTLTGFPTRHENKAGFLIKLGRIAMSLGTTVEAPATTDWWRSAVVYQLYIRSFADGDGDGVGDIAGIRAHLAHLRDLGVDAVWINPWYPSPMADAGYDVSDYRAIEPAFGT